MPLSKLVNVEKCYADTKHNAFPNSINLSLSQIGNFERRQSISAGRFTRRRRSKLIFLGRMREGPG